MAIGSDSAVYFYGTEDTVTATGGTSTVANVAYSASGDVVSGGWSNDDDAPLATFVLKFQYASGTIADNIDLYVRLINIDGTSDEPQTDSGWEQHYLGSFVMDTSQATSTDTYYTLANVALPTKGTSQAYEFYVYNNSDVTMAANWTLKVTPITMGPHA